MLRLEKLQISGFKSFAERTEVVFGEGITAVVGPNGCGKSNIADAVTWVLGLYLVWDGGWYTSGWLHGKLLLVLVLSGLHGVYVRRLKEFAADRNTKPAKYYRILNEVPTVLMIGIVILVIVKPFSS